MYKISIERTETVRDILPKSWERMDSPATETKYGYTPEVETLVTETVEVYMQVVDHLDLLAVIDAINKQPRPQLHVA